MTNKTNNKKLTLEEKYFFLFKIILVYTFLWMIQYFKYK